MPKPELPALRTCCASYNGGKHQPDCTSRGGRPVTTGETPVRNAGRHGRIWDDCAAQAAADGQTMTTFVREAITRELDRRLELGELEVRRARIADAEAAANARG